MRAKKNKPPRQCPHSMLTVLQVNISYCGTTSTIAIPATNLALMNLEKGPTDPEGIKAFTSLAQLYMDSYLPQWMEHFHSDTETLPCQKCGSPCFSFQSILQVKNGNISRLMFEGSPSARCQNCRKLSGIVVGSTVDEVKRMM